MIAVCRAKAGQAIRAHHRTWFNINRIQVDEVNFCPFICLICVTNDGPCMLLQNDSLTVIFCNLQFSTKLFLFLHWFMVYCPSSMNELCMNFCLLCWHTKLHPNQTTPASYRLSKWRPWTRPFRVCWRHSYEKKIVKLYFNEISESTVEVYIHTSGFGNKRRPYWNSTSGFKFELFVSSAFHLFGLVNFIEIGPSAAELWRHRWRL